MQNFSVSSDSYCFTWPRIAWGWRWRCCSLLLVSLSWVVSLILLLAVINYVALAAHASLRLGSAHSWHAHHTEIATHPVIKKHAFEFSVSEKAQYYCNDVENCQHANHCKLKRCAGTSGAVNLRKRPSLYAKTDNIDVREEVDRDVNHVECETAEVHLC